MSSEQVCTHACAWQGAAHAFAARGLSIGCLLFAQSCASARAPSHHQCFLSSCASFEQRQKMAICCSAVVFMALESMMLSSTIISLIAGGVGTARKLSVRRGAAPNTCRRTGVYLASEICRTSLQRLTALSARIRAPPVVAGTQLTTETPAAPWRREHCMLRAPARRGMCEASFTDGRLWLRFMSSCMRL